MNVLVIEDEEKIASFVREGLETRGFTVTVADNGDDGFEQAASGALGGHAQSSRSS